VLVILAHPDDEITIAPVLSRITRRGGEVTLVFVTSGDAGPGVSGLEPGAELAALREDEARCSAFSLGLDEPQFWQLGDGTLGAMARAPGSAARVAIGRIAAAIAQTSPRVIMTWGPDGGYGHSDHRMVSNAVTQVVQGLGPDRPDLLYAVFPEGDRPALPEFEQWSTIHPSLVTDRIRYDLPDLDAARAAINCYQSQFDASARAALPDLLHQHLWQGTVYFRLAFPGTS
jgi:LmbE family N-acetylglucosaminyl deacetylase